MKKELLLTALLSVSALGSNAAFASDVKFGTNIHQIEAISDFTKTECQQQQQQQQIRHIVGDVNSGVLLNSTNDQGFNF